MDITILTPNPTSGHLKCFVCKNYLSYFPISLCSNSKNVCGRCNIPEDLVSYKNESFEEICQHFKFPCCFQSEGCSEEFLPKDIPEHEDKCPFRVVKCIINNPEKCQWQGSLPDLLRHCENQHSDLVLKNHEFEMDPSDAEEYDNLVKFEDEFLIFRRKYDPKRKELTFGLRFSKNGTNAKILLCQLRVKNDKKTVLFDFESTESDVDLTEVSLKSLYSKDKPDIFLGKLRLPENEHANTVQENELNTELLKLLKCAICSLILKPPVFCCVDGTKFVCSSCQTTHVDNWGVCDEYWGVCDDISFGIKRNNAEFDKFLRNYVKYPCKNKNNGCIFSSNHETLEEHQVSCEYENTDCPLSDSGECAWKSYRKDLRSHILDDHTDCIHTSSEITYELLPSWKINMSFMKFSRHLFRLSYDCGAYGERYRWSLQKIGGFDTKHRFEVEIFGDTPGLRFLAASGCSVLSNHIFKDDNFCYILKDQVGCLRTDKNKNLEFKVRIFEM